MDLGLTGKTAFISGGSAGIGMGIARALLAEGASVAICGRDQVRLAKSAEELGAYGVAADVTDPDRLREAIDDAAGRLGGLDLLVANAGGSQGGDLLDSTPEDWAATYAVNVLHAAHAVRCAVPHFDGRGGGSVVIVSSVTGWKPGPKSSYASAKAAEIHLAATLAQELAGHGVRVNALSPGSTYFEGGGWAELGRAQPDRLATFAREDFPAGRLVTLEEVADAACFLLSPRASGINGANICVDGAQDHPSARRLF
ncbi:MAG: 3-oxoacyl-ACP reductase [Actinoallomurus sp.]|nr:3-oxoacyl-ACP reductase [Actinoallomurus sp.]